MKWFCYACVGIIVFSVLGICWWWIEFYLRYRLLRRIAVSLNHMADQIEAALEAMRALAEESEKVTEEIRAMCNKKL